MESCTHVWQVDLHLSSGGVRCCAVAWCMITGEPLDPSPGLKQYKPVKTVSEPIACAYRHHTDLHNMVMIHVVTCSQGEAEF
jgi:hypothetical protein